MPLRSFMALAFSLAVGHQALAQQDNDPVAITRDYKAARRDDRWSAGTLLAGTGAFALGVYWRFIRQPAPGRPARIGLAPSLTSDHAGLALRVTLP